MSAAYEAKAGAALERLGLDVAQGQLDQAAQQAAAGSWSYTSAALHRLLHRSTVINIRGDSYRLKEKRQARAASTKEVP